MPLITERALADHSGTTVERVQRLRELGILQPGPEGGFTLRDIDRVRLADALEREGIPLEDVGRATREGQLSFGFMDDLFGHPVPLREQTVDQWAMELGLSMEDLRRLYVSWGLAAPLPGQPVRDDDARMLEGLKAFAGAGLDTEILVAATRYFGDNVRRIAEAQVQFFKQNVIDPMATGMPLMEALEKSAPISATLQPVAKAFLDWLHGRHFEGQVFQETVLIIEEVLEGAGYPRRRTTRPPAIAFLDLSGFTRLTEESGDRAATLLAEGLAALVGEAAASYRARVVKTLGDGVMFYFIEPADALVCGLSMVDRAAELGLPRARVGINAGDVVFRDGDYFGRTVNVAARITDYARPGEVLAGEDAVAAAAPDGVSFTEIGPVLLRGLLHPIRVFKAARSNTA